MSAHPAFGIARYCLVSSQSMIWTKYLFICACIVQKNNDEINIIINVTTIPQGSWHPFKLAMVVDLPRSIQWKRAGLRPYGRYRKMYFYICTYLQISYFNITRVIRDWFFVQRRPFSLFHTDYSSNRIGFFISNLVSCAPMLHFQPKILWL